MTTEVTLPALHRSQYDVAQCKARFIVLVTGRRWGKTFFGAARCLETALLGGRAWWVAPTYPMTRVGWRVVQQLALQIPGTEINRADRIAKFSNGGTIEVRSGHDPASLRGDGLDLAVMDECAYMKQECWIESIRPALSDRKGRALFISTPKGGNWFAELYRYATRRQDKQWAAFQFTSASNPYLDNAEITSARDVQSDRLFRQEYLAEILDDVPGALWTRQIIELGRRDEAPDMARVVVAIDPAATANQTSDETGIVAVGIDARKHGYVLEDYSLQGSPAEWAGRACALYHDLRADAIIAEVNQGGDMVTHTIRTQDSTVLVKQVRATRGKYTRAEPVSALYEHGRIHHVGIFPELEDQMCTWVPGEKSPDRLDALVWGFTELLLKPEVEVW